MKFLNQFSEIIETEANSIVELLEDAYKYLTMKHVFGRKEAEKKKKAVHLVAHTKIMFAEVADWYCKQHEHIVKDKEVGYPISRVNNMFFE